MDKYNNEIEVAVNWWIEALKNPKFDIGDPSPSGAFFNLMASSVAAANSDLITEEALKVFKETLSRLIAEDLGSFDVCEISCDYRPEGVLASAAKEAGLSGNLFPVKTVCNVEIGRVQVETGCGVKLITLYEDTIRYNLNQIAKYKALRNRYLVTIGNTENEEDNKTYRRSVSRYSEKLTELYSLVEASFPEELQKILKVARKSNKGINYKYQPFTNFPVQINGNCCPFCKDRYAEMSKVLDKYETLETLELSLKYSKHTVSVHEEDIECSSCGKYLTRIKSFDKV
jgi:hypothetical protein